MKHHLLVLFTAGFISACQAPQGSLPPVQTAISTAAQAAKQNHSTNRLHQIIESSWQFRQQLDAKGNPLHPNQLDDLSPEKLRANDRQYRDYLKQLDQLDQQQLSAADQVNWQILHAQLQNLVDSYQYKLHYMPLSSEYGFHVGLANLAEQSRFTRLKDYQDYLDKLAQIPRQFQQQIHWMKQGLKEGLTVPQVVLTGFEDTISVYIVDDPAESVFYNPFKQVKGEVSASELKALQKQAKTLIKQQILPQYQQFFDFMKQEYIPNARQTLASYALPDGEAFYENRVRHYTTLEMTSEQIHQKGIQEVARIRAEMADIIKEVGFEGSFADFLQFLRTDPQFYATTPEQLLKEAAYLSKKADAQLPKLFRTLPRTPYGVEAVPAAIAPKYTTGRYKGASQDDEPGYYWVNTYALDKRPLYVLEALTLHEAVPGHHLQISLNRELTDLPDFRRKSYISAFGEGWGLYAEWLGLEAGFYQDPYSNFGRLTYEMWRACRLVVDTGIHAKGWSRQRAMDFLANNTALSLHNVRTETDRYISWPGQALSYKMGELTIKRLRRQAEQQLGQDFDIRDFHDALLSQGSVPLTVLETQINQYINEVKNQKASKTDK